MNNIDKRALREAAERAGQNDWEYVYTSDLSAPGRGYITVGGAEAIYCLSKAAGGVKQSENALRYIAAASPKTMLALLDELEAAQSYAKERDEENQDLMLTVGRLRVERETSEAEMGNALCQLLPGCHYMDPPDGGNVTPLEQVRRMVADYRERIAELEAREVKIPELKMLRDYLAEVTHREREDILLGVKLEFHSALQAAGIITKVGE